MKQLILKFLLIFTIWIFIGIVVIYFCASDFSSGIKAYLTGAIPGCIIGYLIVYFKNKRNEN